MGENKHKGPPSGLRYRHAPDPEHAAAAWLSTAVAFFVAMSTCAVLVVAVSTVASWVIARIGADARSPALAGVVLVIGMVWSIWRVARQVYRFTATAAFRLLSPNEPS